MDNFGAKIVSSVLINYRNTLKNEEDVQTFFDILKGQWGFGLLPVTEDRAFKLY